MDVWRAEKQKNGNLHFHLLTDKFIPFLELRDVWNRITEKLGYVSRYRDEMRNFHANGFNVRKDLLPNWNYRSQVRAYREGTKNDWQSPNSTDVHSVRKILNLKAYLIKYLTKDEHIDPETGEIKDDLMKQQGRIWGCDQQLGSARGATVDIDSSLSSELASLIRNDEIHHYHDSYFDVFYIDFPKLAGIGAGELFKTFCDYLVQHFNFNYQKTINYA